MEDGYQKNKMAYNIKTNTKIYEKKAYYTLRFAYTDLDDEARKEGWDSYGKAPDKAQKKIVKKVAKKYPYTYGCGK